MNKFNLYQNRVENSYKISKTKLADNKVKTFKRALVRSYNAETVTMNGNEFKALISGIPTSPQIAKKNFAALKENNCTVGDEILWKENNSHWLITEHDPTETSIFQGSVQSALYTLKWKDPDTDFIYETRACAKGPDETTVSDGVKHSIMFDRLTDSLYLIVSAKTAGAKLLKRYFELMINGKKWQIEVLNSVTHPELLYLQLMEVPINRDTDTDDLVDGKIPLDFTIFSSLDDLVEIELGKVTDLNLTVFRNGETIKDEEYTTSVRNCTLKKEDENESIIFDKLGKASIRVDFPRLKQTLTWEVDVVEDSVVEVVRMDIVGSKSIRSMTENVYIFKHYINSVEQIATGNWAFKDKNDEYYILDNDYFTIVEKDFNSITLKAKNKTGTIMLYYRFEGKILAEKEIKITPLFGGS